MKTKKIEIVNTTYREVYIAEDGTEFDDKNECTKYEASAVGVLKGRLAKMALYSGSEEGVFGTGSDETDAFVVVPKDEEEVKTCQQVAHMLAWNDEWKKRHAEKVEIGKPVVVVFSYDDDAAWIVDLPEIVRHATDGKFRLVPVEEAK